MPAWLRCSAAPAWGSRCVKKSCATTRGTLFPSRHPRGSRIFGKEKREMSLLIRRAISVLGKRQPHMLEQGAISPANAQRRFLLELLIRDAPTTFGLQDDL